MDQLIGRVMSDKSKVHYEVKFNDEDGTVFIKRPNTFGWMQAGKSVKTEQEAIKQAHIFINSQPDIF